VIRTLYFRLVKYNIAVLSNKAFTIHFIYLSRNYESGIVGSIIKNYFLTIDPKGFPIIYRWISKIF